jgi:hypothetical protein
MPYRADASLAFMNAAAAKAAQIIPFRISAPPFGMT